MIPHLSSKLWVFSLNLRCFLNTDQTEDAQNPLYTSTTLDHLGLVAGMVDELGLVEKIDSLIPQDFSQRRVSLGMAVKAMILNGLGFAHRALYLMPHFFRDKPVERLLGPGLTAEHLNDDTLGRALDTIHAFGVETFYYQIASGVVQQLGLGDAGGHLDATSFHVDGDYNRREAAALGVIHIRQGYSRDRRPDLNQVVLQLLVESQAGIPMLMVPLGGHVNDTTGFRDTIATHMEQLQTDGNLRYLVADSALYSAETLRVLDDTVWISRVPETLGLAREMVRAVASELMQEAEATWTYRAVGVVYAGIQQRWLVVYSPEARQRAEKTLQRHHRKLGETELKAFHALCRQRFTCAADAQAALDTFAQGLTLTAVAEGCVVAQTHHSRKGRPAKNQIPDRVQYIIQGQLASQLDIHAQQVCQKSVFLLATNDLSEERLSDTQLLEAYKKDQQKVERGFRFLKDPLFMASTLFLKSPARIMALMAIMTLCLMVYAALEHRIRQGLAAYQQTFPDQKGHPAQCPTARWVFQSFTGIHVLQIGQNTRIVLNLHTHHQTLLTLLGPHYTNLYANSG